KGGWPALGFGDNISHAGGCDLAAANGEPVRASLLEVAHCVALAFLAFSLATASLNLLAGIDGRPSTFITWQNLAVSDCVSSSRARRTATCSASITSPVPEA